MDYGVFAGVMALCQQMKSIPPTAVCAANDPFVLYSLTINNFCIGLWYSFIPLLMFWIEKQRGDITGLSLLGWRLFKTFVIFCGIGHWSELSAIWLIDGIWLPVWFHCFTNIISLATVIFLFRFRHFLIKIPSPATYGDLVDKNKKLNNRNLALRIEVEKKDNLISAMEIRLNLKQN